MKLFDENSIFGRFCMKAGNVILVNLQFILTLIPVVTAGAGLCSMYYCMLRLVRYGDIFPIKDFWRSFRENFKKATITWLVLILLALFLFVDYRIAMQMPGIGLLCQIVVGAFSMMMLLLTMYLFPVMAGFEGKVRELMKYAFFFVGKNIGLAIMIAGINLVPLACTYVFFKWFALWAFLWCFFGFSFFAYINSFFFMRLFRDYLEPLEEEGSVQFDEKILEDMKKLGI